MRRVRVAVAILVVGFLSAAADRAVAQVCLPTFGYGNVGYSAGYSIQQVGWCGPRWGGWCGPRVAWGGWGGWCGPRWGWGCRPWGWRPSCVPPVWGYGCSYAWPAWVGTGWFPSANSVWISAPAAGSFFSGGLVPWPVIGSPLVVPGFVSSTSVTPTVATLVGTRSPVLEGGQLATIIGDLRARRAAARIAAVPRGSTPTARLRAARQVAIGDRHLRAANGDPGVLRQAAEAYRRAAASASDQPDTFIRQAIALVALGERAAADAALARAAALDGRLVAAPPVRGAANPDPVFGDRAAGSPAPLVARGEAIIRQIASQADSAAADQPVLARVAARWAERFGAGPVVIARR